MLPVGLGEATNDAPSCRWQLAPPPPLALLQGLPDYHRVAVSALAQRGISEPAAAREFLEHHDIGRSPFELKGMPEAVTRLRQAIRAGERIAVYGDFDADGVTATALLCQTLTALGADVRSFIPHRQRDGYGVHREALAGLMQDGVKVVITVDCGIRAGEEVQFAKEHGLDVIVTDHHVLPEELPGALAVINPRRPDCDYGFDGFAGVGLAFKLAQSLLRAEAQVASARATALAEADLLDLVALGTVADVVPLLGENRVLVHQGLAALRAGRRPGVRALCGIAGVEPDALTARGVAFVLAPRLNAAGRMGDAAAALRLLLAPDEPTAAPLAAELEAANDQRRAATEQALLAAEAALAGRGELPFVFFADTAVALGVVGLVAGRLAERHYRPAAVVRVEGELARGSARSIPEFDIVAALDEVADLLVRHGGHARAAGFTVRSADVATLESRLRELAGQALDGRDLRPTLAIDAEVQAAELDMALLEAVERLEPFGEGNPRPLLLWRRAPVQAVRRVGEKHLKFRLRGPRGELDAISFGHGDRGRRVPSGLDAVDVVFSLHLSRWGGVPHLELRVRDWRPALP
jgi:single-stranded-DNA-specific exonuclease